MRSWAGRQEDNEDEQGRNCSQGPQHPYSSKSDPLTLGSLQGSPGASQGSLNPIPAHRAGAFKTLFPPDLYLIQGVAHGQVPQEGQAEGFPDEVALQQVCNGLVAVELGIAHPCFGQQPVPLRIIR